MNTVSTALKLWASVLLAAQDRERLCPSMCHAGVRATEWPERRAGLDRSSWTCGEAQGYGDLSHLTTESFERLSLGTVPGLRNLGLWTKASDPLFMLTAECLFSAGSSPFRTLQFGETVLIQLALWGRHSPGSCVRTVDSGCLISPEDDPALSSTADSETSYIGGRERPRAWATPEHWARKSVRKEKLPCIIFVTKLWES